MSPSHPSVHDSDPEELAPQSIKLAELAVVVKQHGKDIAAIREQVGDLRTNNDDRSRETRAERIRGLEAQLHRFEAREEAERIRLQISRNDALQKVLFLIFGGVASQLGFWLVGKLMH